jgi:hypothetical protein
MGIFHELTGTPTERMRESYKRMIKGNRERRLPFEGCQEMRK